MWPETKITSVEILPDYTIQIDFEEDWKNHRSFISFGEFFEKFWKAMNDLEKMFNAYRNVKQLSAHINGKMDLLDGETPERLPNEKAEKERDRIIKDTGVSIDRFDAYLTWV